jgi:predicted Fe-Mo cluster-binding NifX family protein
MKIAVPYADGEVNQHFGRTGSFLIADVVEGSLEESGVFPVEGLQHDHDGLSGFLRGRAVDLVLAGNMGEPMRQALTRAGLEVKCGASGPALDAVERYLKGELQTNDSACAHGHGHHGEGEDDGEPGGR